MRFALRACLLCCIGIITRQNALACDPCALYNAGRLQGHQEGTVSLAISEQYTDYTRGEDIPENSARQAEYVRGYSNTQFTIGYDPSADWGLQLNLPLIVRHFDTIEGYRTRTETDSGLGDIALLASYSLLEYRRQDSVFQGMLSAGLKLPTGDTGDLGDFSGQSEKQDSPAELLSLRHHPIGASGGRALTFGSGSYDYILALSSFARQERYLLLAYAQYTIRTEGDFNYEFADDLVYAVSAGRYLWLEDERSLAGLIAFSGEYKEEDRLEGQQLEGSKVSNVYLGPALLLAYNQALSLEIGLEYRLGAEDAGASIVPERRLRASLGYRF